MDIKQEIEKRLALQKEYLGEDKYINKKQPLVSVSVSTYQHIGFIEKCLEGIISQKTNFIYEVLVGDDESNDGTREICIKYAEKYPKKIRLFLRDRNVSHLKDENGRLIRRLNGVLGFNLMVAKGKYIALCEGDDYWTDPYKLQKQVDFLEKNEDYVICFHNVKVQDETKGGVLRKDNITRRVKATTSWKNLLYGNFMHTPTVVFRREYLNKFFPPPKGIFLGDYYLWLHLAQYGKIKKLDDCMAVYRVHQGGIFSNQLNSRKDEMAFSTFNAMIGTFEIKEINKEVKQKAYNYANYLYKSYLKAGDIDKSVLYLKKMIEINKDKFASDFKLGNFINNIPRKVIKLFYYIIYSVLK